MFPQERSTYQYPPGPDADDPQYTGHLRRAALAASVGSTLEYYDFTLYTLASALIFGKVFFPALGPAAGVVASLATLAVGFVARPVGGLFFGTLGDRLGRKWVLMVTIALMGGASTLIGVLPTGAQVGFWAPVLLVVLRFAQGFGAGAEQAGATTLMAEYAPVRRRGYYSGLPFVGIFAGALLASAVFAVLGTLDQETLLGWAWRVPFLASVILLAVAVYIRLRMRESPAFADLEKHEQVAERPFQELMRQSRPTVLRGIGVRMAEVGGSYIYQTLSITYVTTLGVQSSIGPLAVAFGAALGLVVVPIAGRISDRYGRLPVYRAGAIFQLVFAPFAWWLLSLGNPVATVAVVTVSYGIGVSVMLGGQCPLLPELFGARHRYIGVATAREVSAVLGGGFGPLVGALLLGWFDNSPVPLAIFVAVLSVITLLTLHVTPETRARDITLLGDALDDTEEQRAARPAPS
ncbi:MFS transporter [Pseudonocardia sp. CA-107938]|uniref:MFS transporter n=1 Tax=Pseudonocardia sp. CA-107938 TaxID=3240021 RepID=UPI003D8F61B0